MGVAFYFLWWKPESDKMKENSAKLEAKELEWSDVQTKVARKEPLKIEISEEYAQSNSLADRFITDLKKWTTAETPFGYSYPQSRYIDEYIQRPLDECVMKVTNLAVTEPNVSPVAYTVVSPVFLLYPLFEAADINGDFAKDVAQRLHVTEVLSDRSPEQMVKNTATISFVATKESILSFIEKIRLIDQTVRVDNLSIADYTFGADLEAGNPMIGHSTGSISISFYSTQRLEPPVY
jgi:hypothetical protein